MATKLTGTMENPRGSVDIQDGKVSGDSISFVVVRKMQDNEMKINYKGTISGDELKLTMEVNGKRSRSDGQARQLDPSCFFGANELTWRLSILRFRFLIGSLRTNQASHQRKGQVIIFVKRFSAIPLRHRNVVLLSTLLLSAATARGHRAGSTGRHGAAA